MSLPTDAKARKDIPVATGFIDYFPDAVAEVAALSKIGNDQHNPGKPLEWDRSKSGDESDALMRHFLQRGTFDSDGVRHSAKVAWRAMAQLQKEIEAERLALSFADTVSAIHDPRLHERPEGMLNDLQRAGMLSDERMESIRVRVHIPEAPQGKHYPVNPNDQGKVVVRPHRNAPTKKDSFWSWLPGIG